MSLALEGRVVGNSPSGGCRGDMEKMQGTLRPSVRWPARTLRTTFFLYHEFIYIVAVVSG